MIDILRFQLFDNPLQHLSATRAATSHRAEPLPRQRFSASKVSARRRPLGSRPPHPLEGPGCCLCGETTRTAEKLEDSRGSERPSSPVRSLTRATRGHGVAPLAAEQLATSCSSWNELWLFWLCEVFTSSDHPATRGGDAAAAALLSWAP